jgi:glycosyltransferase involved in cell wall biosynthesis
MDDFALQAGVESRDCRRVWSYMVKRPRISVVMPCFNAAPFIASALHSVYSQSWPDIEVVVVDDGSSDGSVELLREQFPQVRLFQQANKGAAAARNYAVEQATGAWIAFLDADDWWLPGKLAAQWKGVCEAPNVRLVYSDWREWPCSDPMPDDDLLATLETANRSCGGDAVEKEWLYHKLLLDCLIWTSTVLIERKLLDELGCFDSTLPIGEDYDLWLRASRVTEVLKVNRPLALYRKHPASITRNARQENYRALLISRAIAKWGYLSPDGARVDSASVKNRIAGTWIDYAGVHLAVGNAQLARRGALAAIQLQPWRVSGWKLLAKTLLPT